MSKSVAFPSPNVMLRRHGLRAKKSWGQNFLHDPGVASAIVAASGVSADDTVVEIGAGLGALTHLLAARAGRVIAIERDRELAHVLRLELEGRANVEVVEANALTYDLAALGERVIVVGNLPYHISSPLLFHLLEQRAAVRHAVLMFQRELAQRLLEGPGSRLYGAPSVSCRQYAELRACLQVGRGAFTPAPRVDSTVVRLDMREQPLAPADEQAFRVLVRTAFASRRKTLRRALAGAYPADAIERAITGCGIAPSARAETLSVEQFACLAEALRVS